MSQLLVVLSLAVMGFPALESFHLSPATSKHTPWLDPRPSFNQRRRARVAVAPSGCSRCRREERVSSRATSPPPPPPLALGATKQDATEEPSPKQQPKQSVRKKTKRPRRHVPAEDVESFSEVGGGGLVGRGAGFVGDPFADMISPAEYAASDFSVDPPSDPSSSSLPSSSSSSGSTLRKPTIKDQQRFERIMEEMLGQEKEEELPAILTKHIDFLLSVDVTHLTNDLIRREPSVKRVNTLHNAYEFIVTFLESMVESTADIQTENQTVLRLIIEAAKISPDVFEERMQKLQERFSFEFVKYLDAEVKRLEKVEKDIADKKRKQEAPYDRNDPPAGGNEVLNVIKIVRTRVCAQLDLMMGEDVAVLTRMLNYDDRFMMRAALRTVLRDKTPEEIAGFGMLVSKTLEDVVALGSGVDPVLRSKLADMTEDIAAVARDVEERQKDKIDRESKEA